MKSDEDAGTMTTLGDRAIDRLRQLVTVETPSGDLPALTAFADLLTEGWTAIGLAVRRIPTPSGPVLIGDLPGAGWGAADAPVLLIGHADTVWPRGTLDSELPWEETADVVRGPGVFDMKSGLVIMEEIARRLASSPDGHPPLRLYVAPDEETGSVASREHLAVAAVGCRAALGFEAPHPDGSPKVGRFGSIRVRLDVSGRAAHAALNPEAGISAIEELVDQLADLRELAGRLTTKEEPVLFNVGSVTAPGQANVVPASATALLGVRFAHPDQERAFLEALSLREPRRPGSAVTATVLSHRPTWKGCPADVELARRIFPELDTATSSRGAADTNLLGPAGIPRVDGLGPCGGGAHAVQEHIIRSSVRERVEVLVAALTDRRFVARAVPGRRPGIDPEDTLG